MKLKASVIKARREIMKIERRADKARADLRAAQDKCKHPIRYAKYGANTGNYDPHDDCYWTDFGCAVCGKFWDVEGSVRDPDAIWVEDDLPLWLRTLTPEQLKNKVL